MSFPTKSLMIDQMLKLGVGSAGGGRLSRLQGALPSSDLSQSEFQGAAYTRASGDLHTRDTQHARSSFAYPVYRSNYIPCAS